MNRILVAVCVVLGLYLTFNSVDDRRLLIWPATCLVPVGLVIWARLLGPKGRIWLGVTLVIVVTVVLVGLGMANGLGPVVCTWKQGEPTEDLILGSTSMLWWGRLGKLMQFLAGLLVLLDLFGPERLRRVGRWARERELDVGSWTDRLLIPARHLKDEQSSRRSPSSAGGRPR